MTRTPLAAALLTLALPALAPAQGLGDAAVIVSPHFTSYEIAEGAAKRTIEQTAIPIVMVLPFTSRLSFDVSTSFVNSSVAVGGATTSEISGLSDTQIRGNYTFGERLLVLSFGLNLPTGQYTIPEDQQEAAGQIGNDFLNFPISSMGNGLAGTGGVAFARALGSWNLGAGVSIRKSTEFAAFSVSNTDFTFTPADEYRVNIGVDRPVGDGQVQFGLSYSAFGEDEAAGTTYSTGDRIIASGGWSFPVRSSTVFLSGWNLFRAEGERLGGVAPGENVANLNAGVSFTAREVLIQPNLEVRLWQVDGIKAGNLFNTGVRLRFGLGNFSLLPQLGYTVGTLYDITNGAGRDVTGMRGALTIRWN